MGRRLIIFFVSPSSSPPSSSFPSFPSFIHIFSVIVTVISILAVNHQPVSCDRSSPRTLLVNVLSKKHLETVKFGDESNEHRTLIAVPERTISIEFSPPRSRRFPVLKALVRQIVSPDHRRDLSLDASSNVNNNADRSSSSPSTSSSFKNKFRHRPESQNNEYKSGESGLSSQKLPIELNSDDDLVEQDDNNHLDAKQPGNRRFFLVNVLSRMLKSVNFTAVTEEMKNGRTSSRASCIACNAVAALYLSPLYSKEAMVAAARSVCISFRLQSPRVCRGLVDSFKDDLDYIRRNTRLTRQEMCGVVFGLDCARTTSSYLNWTLPIPPDTRKHVGGRNKRIKRNKEYTASPPIIPQLSQFGPPHIPGTLNGSSAFVAVPSLKGPSQLISMVQITDIHIDPYYAPGMNADCGEPLCCRRGSGFAGSSSKAAGPFGDYRNCDTPVASLKSALEHISFTHPDANYWMWTGDISPHDIWNITKEEVIFQIRLVTDLVKQYAKVPVLPVIGNHEGVPVNSFPPPEVKGDLSISWLYDEMAKQWSYWLPDDAIETFRYGGYYKLKVRPGFRVICLNTNYCTRLNPWTLYDPVDPGKQLEWLANELLAAETDADKVHIIGHIPPDSRECTQAWLYNYLRIIDRFQDTVLASYFGHTHRDEFRVLLSPHRKPKPISVAYIGPSITSFTQNNPGYRVYYTDEQGFVKDHETYFYNLTEANAGGYEQPIWRREYNAYNKYNLTNLGPFGWHRFVHEMIDDDNKFQSYFKLYYRLSELEKGCHGECKKKIISDLVVGHPLKTKPRSLFGNRKHR